MKKSQLVVLVIILVTCLFVLLQNGGITGNNEETTLFRKKLSQYGLYQGKMSDLKPCDQAELIDLASPLFTDYAEKHRIIVLPKGTKMTADGPGLPNFPDGTIIAKTFYYPNRTGGKSKGRYLVETRLLIKDKTIWNAATYKWNDAQNEAYLLKSGIVVPIAFVDKEGGERKINYKIPSAEDCISCHHHEGRLSPLGPKLRNINIEVSRGHGLVNQLEYLKKKGRLDKTSKKTILATADYRDESNAVDKRARAYLDINCAHCHNPTGLAAHTQLDLRLETPFAKTGIRLKQGNILVRMTMTGEMHMPKKGTTINHDEGVKLIIDYIRHLERLDKIK